MKYYIDIDYNKCTGCMLCYIIDRNIFGIKNGKIFINKKILENEEEINNALIAVRSCPVNAILIQLISEE